MSRCAFRTLDRVGKPAWIASAVFMALLGSTMAAPANPASYRAGEMLLTISPDTNHNGQLDAGESLADLHVGVPNQGIRRIFLAGQREVWLVRLPQGQSVEAGIAAALKRKDVRILAAEPNYNCTASATLPNEHVTVGAQFDDQWALYNTGQTGGTAGADIDAVNAWDISTGNPQIIVAVIDSGVDYLHPDLVDNIWVNTAELNGVAGEDDDLNGYVDDIYGYDFADNDADPIDTDGHGTHLAGIIGAVGNNALGVVGVNWDVRIMCCRFRHGSGDSSGSIADAVEAIAYAVRNGANVLNCAWTRGSYYSQALYAAIQDARGANVLFVTAAGNDGIDIDEVDSQYHLLVNPVYPAGFDLDNILAVTASDADDALTAFANFGTTSVDIAAPGDGILSTIPNAQVLWTEDFNDPAITPPNFGHTTLMRDSDPANFWVTVDDGGNVYAASDSVVSSYRSYSNGSILTYPARDTSTRRGLYLVCSLTLDADIPSYLDYSTGGDYLDIDITNDGGVTWYTLARFTGSGNGTVKVDVPDALLGTLTQFRWHWVTDNVGNGGTGVALLSYTVSCYRQVSAANSAYDFMNGTSVAAAHAAGGAALIWSLQPYLTCQELISVMRASADPITLDADVDFLTRGRLNVYNAMTRDPMAPYAVDGSYDAVAGGSPGDLQPVFITLDALHNDPSAVLTYFIDSLPEHGSLEVTGGAEITTIGTIGVSNQVTYTPEVSDFDGVDSFTFHVTDGDDDHYPYGGDSNTATITINLRGPTLSANRASLSHSVAAGQPVPGDTLTLTNTGGGNLDYELSVDATWLSVSATTGPDLGPGETSAPISVVYPLASSLTAGVYRAKITVTSVSGLNSPLVIPVTLRVGISDGKVGVRVPTQPQDAVPALQITTEIQEQNVANGKFRVFNSGGTASLGYRITFTDVPWILTVYPVNGASSSSANYVEHTVLYDVTAMNVGVYTATIRVTNLANAADVFTLPVTLNVTYQPLASDRDGDSILDDVDNCPDNVNTDQSDTDDDGPGDVCDACPTEAGDQTDTDNDAVGDACDNCVEVGNIEQTETDGDGLGDACDNCPLVKNANQADTDEDGIGNVCDNCPNEANIDQFDRDEDGIGDACDDTFGTNTDEATTGGDTTGGNTDTTGGDSNAERPDDTNGTDDNDQTGSEDPDPVSNEVDDTPLATTSPVCGTAVAEAMTAALLGLAGLRFAPRARRRV